MRTAPFSFQSPVIPNGAALTNAFCLGNHVAMAIIMPAAWTAASLTFQASIDGTNFFEVYDDAGNEYIAVVAASEYIVLDASRFPAAPYLVIRSGTAGSPVNQGAARTLTVIGRRMGDDIF